MTYTVLAIACVLVAAAVDAVLRTNLLRHKAFWLSYAIMLGFQLLVNGILTGLPVVRYNDADIIGWRVAYAPVEDIMFGFALILITLALWVRLTSAHRVERREHPADR